MYCYIIQDRPTQAEPLDMLKCGLPYAAVLSREEWRRHENRFDMGIEHDPDEDLILATKAEVNYDSITGTFSIPRRADLSGEDAVFAFALDEKGIVFIDDSGTVHHMIEMIASTKRWRNPSLERFLCDFLTQVVKNDQKLIDQYEHELDKMEDAIVHETGIEIIHRVNEIRGDIRELLNNYEQLLDAAEVFEENENGFFVEDNLRYFRLYINRIERLKDAASGVRDFAMQIRDLHKTHLDIKQNNIMTVLTIVTTIFMPLTLIVGWYGMNFTYMPELSWPWAYPAVLIVCIVIVVGGILYFKIKKWL